MGAFLDKPDTRKSSDSGKGNGISYGVSSMQGWRVEMEDAHAAKTGLPGELKSWSYFGVFDGHAGSRVSGLCSTHLLEYILSTPIFKELIASTEKHGSTDEIKDGIVAGFMAFDEFIFKDSPQEKSGSTAVVAFVSPTHYFIANCGDSRGVLVKDSKPAFCTEDHKPSNVKEHRRITNAGGHVILSRVNGSLAVSRYVLFAFDDPFSTLVFVQYPSFIVCTIHDYWYFLLVQVRESNSYKKICVHQTASQIF
ncbi:unnamed protein product [Mesocestoides corti]|uniref:PPM-type phosphatase domain-containing protein n=1 Tax=Mesocestoides corti TaxID=53468 RepID=A0A0R3UBM0_MESCO|nr:unnamed protein product [Mesocestoides corti]